MAAECGTSPSRPPLVASLEARRRSSSNQVNLSAPRISDMGPPSGVVTVSPSCSSSSPLSAGELSSREYLRLPNVASCLKERSSTLSITITCDSAGARVEVSEYPVQPKAVGVDLLLSALEDVKDKLLRSQHDEDLSAGEQGSRPFSASSATRTRKRSLSTVDSADRQSKRLKFAPFAGTDVFTVPSSEEYLNQLLATFAQKGYGSMDPLKRESLMMSTLSSTYASLCSRLRRAQAAFEQCRHNSIVFLGQRDEASSRLKASQEHFAAAEARFYQSRRVASQSPSTASSSTSCVSESSPIWSSPSSSQPVESPLSTAPSGRESRGSTVPDSSPDSLLTVTLMPIETKMTSEPWEEISPSSSLSDTLGLEHREKQPLLEYRDIQSVGKVVRPYSMSQVRKKPHRHSSTVLAELTPTYLSRTTAAKQHILDDHSPVTSPDMSLSALESPLTAFEASQVCPDNSHSANSRRFSMPSCVTASDQVDITALSQFGHLLQQSS